MDEMVLSENTDTNAQVNPIRLAWGIILVAFAAFCIVCAGSVLGLHYFFFESSLSLDAILHVGRGTVGIRLSNDVEQAESSKRTLSEGMLVRTDQTDLLSQATISLYDPAYNDSLVASFTLKSDTSVHLRSASRPRFQWSSPIYHSELAVTGTVDILISDNLNRDIQIVVYISDDTALRFESSGRYSLAVLNKQVKVTNLEGKVVFAQADGHEVVIGESQKGILEIESGRLTIEPALIDLVINGDLDPFSPDDTTNAVADRLVGWSCTNQADASPNGTYRAGVAPDGRPGFRLVRDGVIDSSGSTRCVHTFNTIDVANYDYLAMQTTLYVSYQSLSRCGTIATECPLMLYISYIDENGDGGLWRQGLYARDDASTNYLLRCDTCINNHIRIYDNVWYTYTSENLIELLNVRPAIITDIVFYASGHQYDVFVDEVRLLAGYTQAFDATTSADGE